MEKLLRILHLEDNPTDVKLCEWTLQEESIQTTATVVTRQDEFAAALEQADFDLILSDYNLPTFTGLDALAVARQQRPDIPFIFVTGTMGEDLAIESLKSGATDYVLKQKLGRLAPAVRRAILEAEERTERARAEAASRRADSRFRTLFEQFPFSLHILAPDGHTLRINQAFERLWNLSLDDLANFNVLQDQQLVDTGAMPYIEKALVGEASAIPDLCYETTKSLPQAQGRVCHVEAFICPVKDEAGQVTEIVFIHRDVTEERQTQAALRHTEGRLRALADANLIGILFSAADGGIADANDAFLNMVGYSRAELQAGLVHWTELTPPEWLHLDERGIAEADARGSCVPYEKEYIRKDGTRVPILIGYARTEAKDYVAFILDLTDLKRANLALQVERAQARESEQQYRFLAEATTLLASSLDFEASIKRVAQLAVPRMADWCFVDFIEAGKLRRIAIAHQDPAQVALAERLWQEYPPREDSSFGVYHVARTGESEIVADLSSLLRHAVAQDDMHFALLQQAGFKSYMGVPLVARGQVLGVMSFVTSQSRRPYQPQDLALAEELARSAAQAGDTALLYRAAQQAREAAEEASRAKDEFLATLSHELRTPLNAILGWISLLRTGRLDAATAATAMETVERNTRAQTQLIEDILDVSRIITGKLHLESQPVSLVAVIEAATTTVRPAAEAKGIGLRASLDFSLGPVAGDAHRLQQVVWNLLSNAIKFTPRGGSVDICLERLASHVIIIVSDTGMGIIPEFQPYVFDRFRQADSSSTREYGGLGLGLAIVRHLVEMHGGWVEVASSGEGQGATFTVHLPLMAVHPTEFPVSSNTQASSGNANPELGQPFHCPPALEGLRVLVVDDENDARQLIAHVLEQCQATVKAVSSVAAAIAALSEFKPDVLVSDIGMPHEDGYALIRKIRALSPEDGGRVPAAALTAYARSEDRTRALAAGYQMHLPKPVEPGELALVVASLVGRVG